MQFNVEEEMQGLIAFIETREKGNALREIAEKRLKFLGANVFADRVVRKSPNYYRSARIADYSNEEARAFQIFPIRRTG